MAVDTINSNSYGEFIISLNGLWICSNNVFFDWYVLQIKIYTPTVLKEYAFIDNDKNNKIICNSTIPFPPPLPITKKLKQSSNNNTNTNNTNNTNNNNVNIKELLHKELINKINSLKISK